MAYGDRDLKGGHLKIAPITYLFDCEKGRTFRRLCSCLVLKKSEARPRQVEPTFRPQHQLVC